jgi:hypothetical protein
VAILLKGFEPIIKGAAPLEEDDFETPPKTPVVPSKPATMPSPQPATLPL